MKNIKSHKTVEQIAKKHRLDVSFIKKQLEIGEPIEHEHTKDHDLAMDIALQHLDEIPDYYTRLKKMESDAKKEHDKKFKDVKEGFLDRLRGRKNKQSKVTYDGKTQEQIKKENQEKKRQKLIDASRKSKVDSGNYDDPWLRSAPSSERKHHYRQLRSEESKSGDDGLHDWFSKSKSSDGKKGWVQLGRKYAGKPCARQPGQTSTPKCGSSKMAASMSPEEEEKARLRKNKKDPNQPEKTGGAKPTYVRTEEMDLQEVKDKPGKGSGKKDACYRKVKSRYDVWPSAYASGALVKCRKVGADNWGNKKEEIEMNDLPMTSGKRYCPKCKKDELRSECQQGPAYWDMFSLPAKIKEEKDHEYSMARSELSTVMNAAKRLKKKMAKGEGNVEAWVQSKITKAADYLDSAADYLDSGEHKVDEERGPCWKGYKQVGMKKKGKRMVPNCVPENITIEDANGNTFAEVIDLIKPDPIKVEEATRLQSQTGNIVVVTLLWRGKYYSIKMFFPQVRMPSKQEMNNEIQKVYPGGKIVTHSVSEFTPGEPLIQAFGPQGGSFGNPGPSKNYVKTMGEDWQKVNRQDKTDGLSQKAVKAYRRENPGSKLQTAVTEKNPTGKRADRRKSFCSRSKGQRDMHNIDCSKTPDKPICKARRRWKC